MKKTAYAVLSTALIAGLLAGCGGSNDNTSNNSNTETVNTTEPVQPVEEVTEGQYTDGKYYAEAAEFDANSGWKEAVALTVEGGQITDVYWTALNKDGGIDKKIYSEQGKYGMKAGGASAEWHEQAELSEQYLLEVQDPAAIPFNAEDGKTDAISGVSIHVNGLAELAQQALDAGPVEEGPYKDGTYYAEEAEFGETGWKGTVELTVLNGDIFAVRWSAVNEAGDDKVTYSKEGKYGMKEGGASSEWHEQALKAEQFLLETQDPAAITYNEDGKTDAISGVTVHVNDFVALVNQALEAAK